MATLRLPDMFLPGAAARTRLSAALALSALLHAAVLYNMHGTGRGGAPSAGRDVLSVQLAPADGPPAPVAIRDSASRDSVLAPDAPARDATATPQLASSITPATPGPNGPAQMSELRYYLGSELDRRATPLHAIEPEFPADPISNEKNVVLRVFISERGTVDKVTVQAAGTADAFEKSAHAAFAAARFAPGILRGAPVKSQFLVEVKFDPNAGNARGTEIATAAERAN